MTAIADEAHAILSTLGVPQAGYTGGGRMVRSPITGEAIGRVVETSTDQATAAMFG